MPVGTLITLPVPTAPTVTSLITEAFARCGVASPTAEQLLRGEDEWLEEVKRDLSADKRWHAIEETVVLIPTAYAQEIPIPSPLIRATVLRWYRGDRHGTATAGGTRTITIAAGTGVDTDLGRKLFTLGGTGSGQVGRIVSRSGDVYTVQDDWVTVPDNTTTYFIAESERQLRGPDPSLSLVGGGPGSDYQAWDYHEASLRLSPPLLPSIYGALEIDGIVDISLIPKADPRMVRILREWRSALLRGLIVRIKEDQDDADVDRDERKYEAVKTKLMKQDSQKRRGIGMSAARSVGGLPRRRGY